MKEYNTNISDEVWWQISRHGLLWMF